MKRTLAIILAATLGLSSAAQAFINPRTTALFYPDRKNPGYGLLRIDVIGGAWTCIGRFKLEDDRPVAQKFRMQCRGMVKSANAQLQPDGEFFYKVKYRLNNGIKGHLTLADW